MMPRVLPIRQKGLVFAVVLAALVVPLMTAGSVKADYVLITSRPTGADIDTIDWGQFGGPFTTLSSPQNWVSNGGLTGSVTDGGTLERRDQTTGGWNGNFAPGDHLLWNEDNGNAMTLKFDTPMGFAGAQIQQDIFGSFTATITAFDSVGNVLASFTENGTSNSNGDNSAIFIGIKGPGIASIEFSESPDNGFAINQVSLAIGAPEPGSLALFGVAAAGLAVRRVWRKRKS